MEISQSVNCIVCHKISETACTGCNKILYCSVEHMKQNVKNHNQHCHPYIMKRNDLYGRYLVASRNIKQGEVIFQECPLIFGPNENTNSPICFSCGGIPASLCQSCNVVQVCSPKCPGRYHSNLECDTLKDLSEKLSSTNFINNKIILPLRCLINLKNPKDNWNTFFELESHSEKRRDTFIWKLHDKYIVQVFKKWNLLNQDTDEEFMQKIMGILDVNTFEVRCGIQSQGRALYLEAAMMAHDCCSNCIISVDNGLTMIIKSSLDIKAGEPLTHNYTNTLYGTLTRKEHLLETKYFTCNCKRCRDPTEFGTHLSSLTCVKCKRGFVVFNQISNDWFCELCKYRFSNGLIKTTLNTIQNVIDDLNKNNMYQVENLIKTLSKSLSPNHSFLIDLKQQLAVLLRDLPPKDENLNKRKMLCDDLLFVLNAIEPGISRLRGIALYELHSIVLSLAQLKNNNLHLLEEAERFLKESISLLLYEPKNSPEGDLVCQAILQLKYIRGNIQNIKKNG